MSDCGKRKSEGFTLLEMMIVIGILAILSALAIITYRSQINTIHLGNDSRALNGTLQLAKMKAMSTGMPYGVAFQRGDPVSSDNRGEFTVFIDCNRDGKFTDNNADLTDNSPISSPDACPNNKDPRVAGESIEMLSPGVSFNTILGTSSAPNGGGLESIVFDPLGHGIQGTSLVTGNILIRNRPDKGEKPLISGVRVVGGTGNTTIVPQHQDD